MEFFLARQPIFNNKKKIYAYELLFRNGLENVYNSLSPDDATIDVITNSLLESSISKIVSNKKAFINFTKSLITKEIPLLLPKDVVVVELLEDIEPDKEFLNLVKNLKDNGYTIALDDFIFQKNLYSLIEFADIIKVDFMDLPSNDDREKVIKEFKRPDIKFLAEKVETNEDFQFALKCGYHYFQGYFFSKPEIIKGKKIPQNKILYIELINEVSKPMLDFDKILDIIKRDISLPVKLLKYINSPFFGFRHKIESLKHAIVLLGENELKKWISLLSFEKLAGNENIELLRLSLTRGKVFELLSDHYSHLKPYKDKLFLTGILSTIEAILKVPISNILEELAISDDIKNALAGKKNILYEMLQLVHSFENTNWSEIDSFLKKFKIHDKTFFKCYVQATEWADKIISFD
jgi:c-di-GMP-related signal transduction protein